MTGDKVAAASRLKSEGNAHFSNRDYASAESCYSQALILNPTLSSLYTNRAMCRFNLGNNDGAISDCDACIASDPNSIKAHYYKSKALLALGADLDAACDEALLAYEACRAADDRSLNMTMTHLLQCRGARWERRERARRREAQELERQVLDLLARDTERDVSEAEGDVEKGVVAEEGQRRAQAMKDIFERARREDDRERKVPDWLIDDISFNVMIDPVITHNGRSYERASIQAAINNNAIDPVTREPLAKGELVPNVALKQACEWFLEKNGWAYDW